MESKSITQQLSERLCRLSYEDLSREQIQKIKLHLLDWLGTVIAGKTQAPIEILTGVLRDLGGKRESTFLTDGRKGPGLLAAQVNSASSCIMEMDDLHRESVFHPGSVVIPSALAVAERDRLPGRELIPAIAVGYEVGIRVALAVGTSHYRYWHTTATCGTFGSAAGAARALSLNPQEFVWALGSAGAQAAGLWEFLGESAMSKPLHIGKAAYNGLLSALLAQRGFTGARRILEGEKGFFRAASGDWSEERCLEGLGREFLLEQTSLKLHASCGHTHAAVDATLGATDGHTLRPEQIRRVDVYVYQAALDLLKGVRPDTPTQAKFNLPFCVGTALLFGQANLKDFTWARIEDKDLQNLMAKVRLHSAPELSRQYPAQWASRVEILKRGGERLQGMCEYPKGDPQDPLDEGEVVDKFKSLTEGSLDPGRAKRWVSDILDLEHVADVAKVLNPKNMGDPGMPTSRPTRR